MALVSLRLLLDHAAEHAYGVPAFNVNNLEQIQAIMQAAQASDSPVILQASTIFRCACTKTTAPRPASACKPYARAFPAS